MILEWKTEIGQGVIDCSLSEDGKLLVAGDIAGRVVVLSNDGNIIRDIQHSMPVWGVDLNKNLDLIAVGLASKSPEAGAFVLHRLSGDSQTPLISESTTAAVWDVAIVAEKKIVFGTSWSGHLLCHELISGSTTSTSFSSSLFGISLDTHKPDRLFVTVSGKGIYQVPCDDPGNAVLISRSNIACYNNLWSSASQTVIYGSSGNRVSVGDQKGSPDRHVSTILSSVSAIAEVGGYCFIGDLTGTLMVVRVGQPGSPLRTLKFPGSVWNIKVDSESSRIFVACGDGSLYAYRFELSEFSNFAGRLDEIQIDPEVLSTVSVFLSYAHEDLEVVNGLYEALRGAGCRAWLDKVDLLPGQNWRLEIERAIKTSDFYILCLSQKAVNKRGYLQAEMKKALAVLDEHPRDDVFVIPVLLEKCEIPEEFSDWQWLDLDSKDAMYKLLLTIYLGIMKRRDRSYTIKTGRM